MADESSRMPAQPIVAHAGSYYRSRRYIMVVAIIAFGAYFGYDGFVGWPKQNAEIDRVTAELKAAHAKGDIAATSRLGAEQKKLGDRHDDFGILNQKRLAFALPVLALVYLAWVLRASRGKIELANDVLTVPGHPPVPIDSITEIDSSRWQRKGIATMTYEAAGRSGTLKLDDFIYDQKPIDAIYEVIAKRHGVWVDLKAKPDVEQTEIEEKIDEA